MTPAPYAVETGHADDGRRVCRLTGPGGPLRWVEAQHEADLLRYAGDCNAAVAEGRDPAGCRLANGGAS